MALKAKATQDFVPIQEIRDGIIVLKNGDLRAIVLASSVNLSLKSDDEQKAIILQFKSFLNTLDFSIQISIQSREYIEFIKNFTENVNIMTKNFFVVVPYTHTVLKSDSGILQKLFKRKNKEEEKLAKEEDFEEKRSQLEERVGVIQQGLSRCGIKSAQLGSEEVVEVFYKVFNPGEVEGKIKLEQ